MARQSIVYFLLFSVLFLCAWKWEQPWLTTTAGFVQAANSDNDDNAGFDPNMFSGGPKYCPPYSCPKGFEAVPKWPLKLVSTGCNGMGGLQMFSPRSAGGEKDPTEHCCHQRHACYQTCGTVKSYCDETFLKCGKTACAAFADMDSNDNARADCEKQQQIHELIVNMDMSGCQKFDAEQYAHCECVEKGKKATDKRTRLLRNFYKKFGSKDNNIKENDSKKIATLMTKVDNAKKMAGLLLKLYQKYPASIQIIKDPQQEYMEKLMREAKEKDVPPATPESEFTETDLQDLDKDEL